MERLGLQQAIGYGAVVLVLSLPFYALGLTHASLPFVAALPLSALMVLVPAVAALIMASRGTGVRALLARLRGWPGLGWAALAVAIMPLVYGLSVLALRLGGAQLPVPQWLSLPQVVLALVIFWLGAVCEELGWQGYAYPALGGRPLVSALGLGVIWALWHVVPFAEMGRSVPWMIWHCLVTVALRVLIVWLVESTGQCLTMAVLFHMMSNAPWGAVANFDAFYDPAVTAVLLWLLIAAVVALNGSGLGRRGT